MHLLLGWWRQQCLEAHIRIDRSEPSWWVQTCGILLFTLSLRLFAGHLFLGRCLFLGWKRLWYKIISLLCQGMAANLLNGAVLACEGCKLFGKGHTFTTCSLAWPTAILSWDISLDTMKQWMSHTGSSTRTCWAAGPCFPGEVIARFFPVAQVWCGVWSSSCSSILISSSDTSTYVTVPRDQDNVWWSADVSALDDADGVEGGAIAVQSNG